MSTFGFMFFHGGDGLGKVCLNGIRAPRPPAEETVGVARKGVQAKEHKNRERGVARKKQEERGANQNHPEGDGFHNGVALTREEGRIRDHRETSIKRHDSRNLRHIFHEEIRHVVFHA